MRRIVVTTAPGLEIDAVIGTETNVVAKDVIPFKYERFEDCPDADKNHARQPDGYVERSEWADRKAKTHTCHQCPTCGFWVMWKRKPKAKK